jgi:hypothetical protein
MPRGLTVAQKAVLASRVKRPATFVFLDIPGDPLRAWDGIGTISALGQSWIGVGSYGFVDGMGSERSLRSSGITIGLYGVPEDALAPGFIKKTRGVRYQGQTMEIYMGLCDTDTDQLLSDPWLMWRGKADTMSFKIGRTVSISITAEHYSSMLRRINGYRQSHENHVARVGDANDNFFKFLNRLLGQNRTL